VGGSRHSRRSARWSFADGWINAGRTRRTARTTGNGPPVRSSFSRRRGARRRDPAGRTIGPRALGSGCSRSPVPLRWLRLVWGETRTRHVGRRKACFRGGLLAYAGLGSGASPRRVPGRARYVRCCSDPRRFRGSSGRITRLRRVRVPLADLPFCCSAAAHGASVPSRSRWRASTATVAVALVSFHFPRGSRSVNAAAPHPTSRRWPRVPDRRRAGCPSGAARASSVRSRSAPAVTFAATVSPRFGARRLAARASGSPPTTTGGKGGGPAKPPVQRVMVVRRFRVALTARDGAFETLGHRGTACFVWNRRPHLGWSPRLAGRRRTRFTGAKPKYRPPDPLQTRG